MLSIFGKICQQSLPSMTTNGHNDDNVTVRQSICCTWCVEEIPKVNIFY